jgi:hypothetical protein
MMQAMLIDYTKSNDAAITLRISFGRAWLPVLLRVRSSGRILENALCNSGSGDVSQLSSNLMPRRLRRRAYHSDLIDTR